MQTPTVFPSGIYKIQTEHQHMKMVPQEEHLHIHNLITVKPVEKKGVMYRFMLSFSPYTVEDMVSTCSREQHKQQHFVDLKFSHRYRSMSIVCKQFELHKPYTYIFFSSAVERLEYTSLGNRRVKNGILIDIKKKKIFYQRNIKLMELETVYTT